MKKPDPPASAEFRRVAQAIRDRVRDGTYKPGQRLPAAPAMAEELGSNRSAVERAVRVVAAEGLLTTRQGSGAYVSRIIHSITRDGTGRYRKARREEAGPEGVQARGAFEAELRRMNLVPRNHPSVRREVPPPQVAEILGVDPNQVSVVVRDRRMYAAPADAPPGDLGTPVQIATTYIPLDIAGGTVLEDLDTGAGGMISRLAEMGHTQVRIGEKIKVRTPTPEEAEFLSLDLDNRVCQITHTAWTAEDRAVEVTVHILPASLWELSYSWDIENG
ncbi:GntR family transcriptional regulator [Streptomyces sp. NRRL WC-3742]|uniref:GntR family transcriptional regulator n=1 Tax=Streptomyces sp. NRRL WC-3742 TaxID=1463934 RepID=UPI0004C4D2B4|nr:GntR family transcriptional regulator [Streptomyces sp. NRRL WC-3742]